MLTARPSITEAGLPTTPHDQGSGMVDVSLAARAGIYLDVPAGGFNAPRANPYTGGAQNINLPSITHGACFRTCSITRTFTLMPGAAAGAYSVQTSIAAGATLTPSVTSFNSSAGGQAVSFSVNVDNPALVGTWVYGSVTLVNNSGDGRPNLRLPVSIYVSPFASAAAEAALSSIVRNVTRERDYFDINLSGMVPMPNARFSTSGLVAPVTTTQDIPADPTNNDAYDAGSNTYLRLIQVPATVAGQDPVQYRLTVTTSAANNDIDLFVGRDSNGDSQASAAEELCSSLSSGSNESCELSFSSQASATRYWVLVQNYSGPGTAVRVESVLLPVSVSSTSAMVASGPGQVAGSAAFRIRVAYDEPALVDGESRQGILFIQPTPDAPAIEVPVRLARTGASFEPFALANNVGRAVTLPAGASHDKLYFDVPPHATSVQFTTTNSTGNVDLYVARVASPTGPTIASAPAWNNNPAFRAATGSGNETLTLSGGDLLPGRYYVVPGNSTGATASATVTARIVTQGVKPAFLSGQYANPARSGHGLFVDFAGPLGNPDQWVTVWYAYLEDNTPTWYYSQGATPGADGIWKAELFRVVWNGTGTHAVDVGDVIVTPTGAESMNMSFNLDGRSGFEPIGSRRRRQLPAVQRAGAGRHRPLVLADAGGLRLQLPGHRWRQPAGSLHSLRLRRPGFPALAVRPEELRRRRGQLQPAVVLRLPAAGSRRGPDRHGRRHRHPHAGDQQRHQHVGQRQPQRRAVGQLGPEPPGRPAVAAQELPVTERRGTTRQGPSGAPFSCLLHQAARHNDATPFVDIANHCTCPTSCRRSAPPSSP